MRKSSTQNKSSQSQRSSKDVDVSAGNGYDFRDTIRQSLHPSNAASSIIQASGNFATSMVGSRNNATSSNGNQQVYGSRKQTNNRDVADFIGQNNKSSPFNQLIGKNASLSARGKNVAAALSGCSGCMNFANGCSCNGGSFLRSLPVWRGAVKTVLKIPLGYVASLFDVESINELPFVIISTDNKNIILQPNEGAPIPADREILFTALGINNLFANMNSFVSGNVPFEGNVILLLLSNLPGKYARFNGIYKLRCLELALSIISLERLDWVEACCAPRVSDYLEVTNGSSAIVWEIDEVSARYQTVEVNVTGIESFRLYRLLHTFSNEKCGDSRGYYLTPNCEN